MRANPSQRQGAAYPHPGGGGANSLGSLPGTYILFRTFDQAYSALPRAKYQFHFNFRFPYLHQNFPQNLFKTACVTGLGQLLLWSAIFHLGYLTT